MFKILLFGDKDGAKYAKVQSYNKILYSLHFCLRKMLETRHQNMRVHTTLEQR